MSHQGIGGNMSMNSGMHALVRVTSLAPVFCASANNAEPALTRNKLLNPASLQRFLSHDLDNDRYLHRIGTLDLTNSHFIPLGLGGGKAWKSGSNILNAFVEPQRKADGFPQFTPNAGINVTFEK